MSLSHFDEKSGIVPCKTSWGQWWQTIGEVTIEVNLQEGTRGKEVSVMVKPKHIECCVKGNVIFKGNLYKTVIADDTVWTIEEQKLLRIQLTKADPPSSEKTIWESLLEGEFTPDPWTLMEMRKKIDLEKFQMENPGFDFSNAQLSKNY